jgi:cytochrome d ubiquinol oxidase subunit II
METLQVIWFLIIGFLIAGYAILDGFDLGVGFWHLFAKKKGERTAFIHSIEPFWDGNEVWLLTAGGALFAAFPPVYATVFSGFYLAMMLVLLGLIFRAVSIEFRNKVEHSGWVKAWDFAFAFGSILPSILYGVAIGNVLQGLELNAIGDYTGGFFALLNPFALLIGLTGLSMFALHGALYLAMKLDGAIADDARKWAGHVWWGYAVFLVVAVIWGSKGFLHELKLLPILLSGSAVLVLLVTRLFNAQGNDRAAFLSSCFGIALVMFAVAAALFPNLVPCTNNPEWSLTLYNSSSSRLTLVAMLIIVVIGMPVVLGYTWFIHRIFRGKVKVHED